MELISDNAEIKEQKKGVRESRPRSKTGCITCRKRHKRCDERRPVCLNCIAASRICEYAPTRPPLRERKAQDKPLPPWMQQQQTFAVSCESSPCSPPSHLPIASSSWQQLSFGATMDPFESFSIKMPLKSKQLFQYFYQAEGLITPKRPNDDFITLVPHDPLALRNTLLLAALHHLLASGSFKEYESTFYIHKLEGIRLVNKWIGRLNAQRATSCVSQIVTLGFAECISGNSDAAIIHLEGLIKVLDTKDRMTDISAPDLKEKEDMINKYLVLVFILLHTLKSLTSMPPPTPEQIADRHESPSGRIDKPGNIDDKLRYMRMMPYFLSPPPPGKKFRNVDASPMIHCLRDVTEMIVRLRCKGIWQPSFELFNGSRLTQLMLAYIKTHVLSVSSHIGDDYPPGSAGDDPGFTSSWIGAAITASLYQQFVLGLWDTGRPLPPIHRRLLALLRNDVELGTAATEGGLACDLYLWKVFTGAVSLSRALRDAPSSDGPELLPLVDFFRGRLRAWSCAAGAAGWRDMRAALARVVWPECFWDETEGQRLWTEATTEMEVV